MAQQIVGCFDNQSDAQQVSQELMALGIDRSKIRLSQEASSAAATTTTSGSTHGGGFWDSVKDAFGFGEDDDRYGFREATRRGGTIVAVTAEDAQTDRVIEVMQRHNVIDLDERARQWGAEGWSGYQKYESGTTQAAAATTSTTAAAATPPKAAATSQVRQGEEAIPVVEEELRIGKRAVSRGGIRVVSHVTERPVEEQVHLREEHVNVERRPVDRPLTTGDVNNAFQERVIEATETAEEAVVSKSARVVEEVVVNKGVQERTETVRDTVRRTDVDVQRTDQADERFRPAYAFADEISADTRYHGRSFDEVETDLRSSYEQRNPNSRWDDVRDAVRSRYGRSRSGT